MAILQFRTNFAGEEDTTPRLTRINTNNTLAEITAAGYLNPYVKSQGLSVYSTDFVFAVGTDGMQIYKPVIGVDGVITLTVLP